MALFMDVHSLGDPVTLADVANAHAADLAHQDEHDVHYLRYWVDDCLDSGVCGCPGGGAVPARTGL